MISERLKQVILKELRLVDFTFTDQTIAPQVPGWDSLNHIKILSAVENEFNIRFKTLEILRLKTVGELQALVDKKTGN